MEKLSDVLQKSKIRNDRPVSPVERFLIEKIIHEITVEAESCGEWQKSFEVLSQELYDVRCQYSKKIKQLKNNIKNLRRENEELRRMTER